MIRFLNKYIIITVIFYAFWILGIPFIFSKVLPSVCENISLNSEYVVQIENPELVLSPLPKATFKLQNINIKAKKTGDYTNLKNFKVTVRILPLLSGRVHVNNIYASEIVTESFLEKEPELDKDFFSDLKKAKVCLDELKIDTFSLKLFQQNKDLSFEYDAHDVYYKKNARALKLNVFGNIRIYDSESEANIKLYLPQNNYVKKSVVDVKIENFNLAPLGDYMKHYLPQDLIDINGIVDIRIDKQNLHAIFENCSVIMKDNAKSIIFPHNLEVKSKFNITSKVINFDKVDIISSNIEASLKGYILNYLDKSATNLNFDVVLNKSKAEDIINMLPPIITEDFNVYKIKHYKFFGNAIGNFTIKGNIFEPEIFGNIFVSDGVLIKPIKNAKGALIKLNFIGKYLNYDVTVPAGDSERVWVKGGVELYNVKYADMHIWSTKNVDLATAEEKVVPLHEILNFVIGPVPIMDVKGYGNIDITVKGNRKNPHVWGVLNVNEVKTYFNEIPNLVLENAKAVLTFNDQSAEFKTLQGFVNGKPFVVNGTCNLSGKFDFDVNSDFQEISNLYNAVQTSTMIEEVKSMLPKLDIISGFANVKLKVYGSIIDITDIQFNKNLFAKGKIELLNNTFGVQGVEINKTNGVVNFDTTNANMDITSFIGHSKMKAKADVKNDVVDLDVSIPKLNLNDLLHLNNDIKSDIGNILMEINCAYKGNIENIEYDKIKLNAQILGANPENKLKVSNGKVVLNNGKLKIANLKGNITNTPTAFDVNLDTENIFSTPRVFGTIQLKAFDLTVLNYMNRYSFIPEELRKIRFENGKINLNCKIHNNKANAYSDLGGVMLTYIPLELPIKIVNGSLMIRNNNLRLNKLNILADDMPILADGVINDIFKKQNFDVYINSKPKQEFIDKYINKNQIYPVKIKGDIVYTLRTKGVADNFDVKAEVNLPKDSSIYHLGAIVGDVENAIVLNLDTKILNKNILRIKEFSYDKLISSLGNRQTRLNMLKAKGGIEVYSDDLVFHDLFIKTQNPTDARIFNIIFRKPNIKQGQFTSDLKFNGKLSNPTLIGDFHIFETNIPFLDTTMKNITFKFRDKFIELSSKGEILGNDVHVEAFLKNKLTPSYYVEKAELYTSTLDLNNLIDKVKLSQLDGYHTFDSLEGIDLSSVVIKEINLNADKIYLRNLVAADFEAKASLSDKKVADVSNFKFNIASGVLNGKFNYNLINNKTNLSIKAKDINANDLTNALFGLNNQIYGDLTGDIKLSCAGENFDNCMKTLNGITKFNVIDGRMPKLGSLEYLLKAGNLVKGGLTGISINSVIDIITPLKTGNFSGIYGNIDIKDGIAEDISIATQGQDLSLFISGKYNFSNSDADMEVYGMLSKKISTMFGPLGNLSLNTLFNAIPGVDLSKNSEVLDRINKVPGIELSSKAYRKFVAEIQGNINGENYVTSFKWIN